jgi:hypothetical protein
LTRGGADGIIYGGAGLYKFGGGASARLSAGRVAYLLRLVQAAGAGAVGTTEEPPVDLNAVPDDPALAVLALWRHPVYGAFERVEHVYAAAGRVNLERQLVVVTTNLADCHAKQPPPR